MGKIDKLTVLATISDSKKNPSSREAASMVVTVITNADGYLGLAYKKIQSRSIEVYRMQDLRSCANKILFSFDLGINIDDGIESELAKMFKVSNEIIASIIDIAYSSSINKGELFKKDITDNLKAIKDIEASLSDINGFMISKFKSLSKTYGKERKTRIVNVDKLYDSNMLWKELLYAEKK